MRVIYLDEIDTLQVKDNKIFIKYVEPLGKETIEGKVTIRKKRKIPLIKKLL